LVSRTLSPISSMSPSIRMIGSNYGLVTLDFFQGPSFSYSLYRSTRNGVLYPTSPQPPCSDYPLPLPRVKGTYHSTRSRTLLVQFATSQHAPFPLGPSPWSLFYAFRPTTRPSSWFLPSFSSPQICWIPWLYRMEYANLLASA